MPTFDFSPEGLARGKLSITDLDREFQHALTVARRQEREAGKHCWVTRDFEGTLRIVDKLPLLGECYDSDGIRHG